MATAFINALYKWCRVDQYELFWSTLNLLRIVSCAVVATC